MYFIMQHTVKTKDYGELEEAKGKARPCQCHVGL